MKISQDAETIAQTAHAIINQLTEENRRLHEWKAAILSCCKTCDGFDTLQWGGDKEGWGFVLFFIDHLNTRAMARCPQDTTEDRS